VLLYRNPPPPPLPILDGVDVYRRRVKPGHTRERWSTILAGRPQWMPPRDSVDMVSGALHPLSFLELIYSKEFGADAFGIRSMLIEYIIIVLL